MFAHGNKLSPLGRTHIHFFPQVGAWQADKKGSYLCHSILQQNILAQNQVYVHLPEVIAAFGQPDGKRIHVQSRVPYLEPDGWTERGNLLKVNEYFIHFQRGDYFSLTNFDWVYNIPQLQKTK